jgi:hypothetical protein
MILSPLVSTDGTLTKDGKVLGINRQRPHPGGWEVRQHASDAVKVRAGSIRAGAYLVEADRLAGSWANSHYLASSGLTDEWAVLDLSKELLDDNPSVPGYADTTSCICPQLSKRVWIVLGYSDEYPESIAEVAHYGMDGDLHWYVFATASTFFASDNAYARRYRVLAEIDMWHDPADTAEGYDHDERYQIKEIKQLHTGPVLDPAVIDGDMPQLAIVAACEHHPVLENPVSGYDVRPATLNHVACGVFAGAMQMANADLQEECTKGVPVQITGEKRNSSMGTQERCSRVAFAAIDGHYRTNCYDEVDCAYYHKTLQVSDVTVCGDTHKILTLHNSQAVDTFQPSLPFFDGQNEKPGNGELRWMLPSSMVATTDYADRCGCGPHREVATAGCRVPRTIEIVKYPTGKYALGLHGAVEAEVEGLCTSDKVVTLGIDGVGRGYIKYVSPDDFVCGGPITLYDLTAGSGICITTAGLYEPDKCDATICVNWSQMPAPELSHHGLSEYRACCHTAKDFQSDFDDHGHGAGHNATYHRKGYRLMLLGDPGSTGKATMYSRNTGSVGTANYLGGSVYIQTDAYVEGTGDIPAWNEDGSYAGANGALRVAGGGSFDKGVNAKRLLVQGALNVTESTFQAHTGTVLICGTCNPVRISSDDKLTMVAQCHMGLCTCCNLCLRVRRDTRLNTCRLKMVIPMCGGLSINACSGFTGTHCGMEYVHGIAVGEV